MQKRIAMRALALLALCASFIGCSEEPKSGAPDGISSATIQWPLNKESAVKNRGGYTVYVSGLSGFTEGQEIKKIDVPGSSISGSTGSVTISDLQPGRYYAKIKAYSDLINPFSGKSSVSEFSDEVTFVIAKTSSEAE